MKLEKKINNAFSLELEEDYQLHPELIGKQEEKYTFDQKELQRLAIRLRKIDQKINRKQEKLRKKEEKTSSLFFKTYDYFLNEVGREDLFIIFLLSSLGNCVLTGLIGPFLGIEAAGIEAALLVLLFSFGSSTIITSMLSLLKPIYKLVQKHQQIYAPEKLKKISFQKRWKTKREKQLEKEQVYLNHLVGLQQNNWSQYHDLEARIQQLNQQEVSEEQKEIIEITSFKEKEESFLKNEIDLIKKQIDDKLKLLMELQPKEEKSAKVKLSFEQLMISVGDHYEIDPRYRDYLPVIDFTGISLDNVNISGLDLSKTNASFDPQEVYKKNLNGGKYQGDFSWVTDHFQDVHLNDATIIAEEGSITNIYLASLAEYNENSTFVGCHVFDENGIEMSQGRIKGIQKTKKTTHR